MKKLLVVTAVLLFIFSCEKDEKINEYLLKLREYPLYNSADTSSIGFTYMASDDEDLQNIKEKYDLPAVAGNGDELSQIFNLMLWVNTNVRHDGSSQNPSPPNADNIIETAENENRGVNCRMLAIVLNDFYLSMGFKSRFVTCKPFDHEFSDCHVVNVVYSNQLDKWIMMDPSFAGYFKDENGNYLGLSEVRERLVSGNNLVISDHLNHNRDIYTKQNYRTYMSKNLFRLSCPLKSEYNYEAINFSWRKYVELIPVDYQSDNHSNYIYTRNPEVYWENP